jgi:hypothetical protein
MSDTIQPEEQFKKIWQKVPQEERTAILSRAQSRAVEVCALLAIFSCAAAFGLHVPAIALGAAACLPLVYQVVVARTVLDIKPQTVARYFMATRTATQYAQALHSCEPTPKALFRGILQPIPEEAEDINPDFAEEYAEERMATVPDPKEVWISLFPDTLVMFSENQEGARLEFNSPILHDFSITLDSPEDLSGNPLPHQLVIETTNASAVPKRWLLTSPHTSSLLACERKARFFAQRAQTLADQPPLPAPRRGSHSLFASKQLGATLESVSHG